ncbi:hypothetical protein [Phaeobacter inhibens]|uniref:hypothetical protein n=1 Tax=Phaeobacter inhibens TaxID=221822 RepID=UPI000C99A571|nr:hypothetical protein [Phaeobacter inhibens]AUQ61802.1 hypothetical protein PhaeoP51_00789 [Phaeobacter inhibens]AUQ81776.1 hypothetical protein PhaeoP57_00821 [Phaeobacter inhibens]AUQ89499.1 hypothetical protein PhaeoP24_00856 [Phaeobacter inhibens]MDO6757106.1 hypothetical protein [Phaeobacter inhibens]
MIFLPFFAASMLSLTAFLQSEAAWWKGPLAALVLFWAGFGVAVGLSDAVVENSIAPPAMGIAAGAWLGAGVIGLGAVLALILRKSLSPGRIAGTAFLGGFAFFSVLPFLI